jgi:hypothetical protein
MMKNKRSESRFLALKRSIYTTYAKEEAGKWSRKREKCNVPCVGIRVQVSSSGISVQVAA